MVGVGCHREPPPSYLLMPSSKVTLTCPVCGSWFTLPAHVERKRRAKGHSNLYCGRECGGVAGAATRWAKVKGRYGYT